MLIGQFRLFNIQKLGRDSLTSGRRVARSKFLLLSEKPGDEEMRCSVNVLLLREGTLSSPVRTVAVLLKFTFFRCFFLKNYDSPTASF